LEPPRRVVPIGSTPEFASEDYLGFLKDNPLLTRFDMGVWCEATPRFRGCA